LVLDLWLIRHGETDWNTQGRIQGSSDQPLNAIGLGQALRLAARLAGVPFDAVYASDLERAYVTAETALPDAELRLDPRLRELAYGILEGKAWIELSEAEAAAAARWREDPYRRRVPGGESYDDLVARFASFRAELPESGTVAAFSHGGTIRSAVYDVVGRPEDGAWRLRIDNTSITRLRFDEGGVTLVTVNDHAHLANGVPHADRSRPAAGLTADPATARRPADRAGIV
jgi:2,3-bisphosphoglycerate-dependent phosphoglycerate mutase